MSSKYTIITAEILSKEEVCGILDCLVKEGEINLNYNSDWAVVFKEVHCKNGHPVFIPTIYMDFELQADGTFKISSGASDYRALPDKKE